MNALDLLVSLLKKFEGLRLVAYQDIVGVWTIGYGETLGVKEGDVWTLEWANTQLKTRAGYFLAATLNKCPQLLLESPERQAACASLAYNIGVGAFGASSVCRKTKRCDYAGAADSFLLWTKAGGKSISGLVKRRKLEREVYLK
jgi:lysozyme